MPARAADDAYRFAAGAGEETTVELAETAPGTLRWTWPAPASPGWDTALLGLRVKADGAAPRLEVASGSVRIRHDLDPAADGLRWISLAGVGAALAPGAAVDLHLHEASVLPGRAVLRRFANRIPLDGKILVLAPHPDDAEIAAFGLYAGREATIVTLTSGNAGDANYAPHFDDPAAQYQWKGFLRAVDSVTVPWLGGIPPERCYNLGYFDARLAEMHDRPREVVPEMYGPNTDVSVYRRANVGRLVSRAPRPSTWQHLVEDLAAVFKKVKPAIVVMPYPQLDSHRDHQFTTVAAVAALERLGGDPRFLLYTNHVARDRYPFGPVGGPMSLPPWPGPELTLEGVYSHAVDPELQRRKLFALESMHDLRLSPAEQATCADASLPRRPDHPRNPETDYLRRGPRSEEIFYVYGRRGVEAVVREFLAARVP
jgi:LmbE family N-acetylglucosaminyl deacetylase